MSQGKVVQCIGAVVDVEFPRDQMPKVYDALILDEEGSTAEAGLTLEDFQGRKYIRLNQLRYLLENRRLDESLRWKTEPAGD